ncbi:Sec-independent protein translocase protein TatCd [Neobacillus rhizosphaerae]|uniref:Sec-independent protein translocase protein TatC n=1 Tax=Neobacillus rhizosphaerae TaxID=2880965 RepID=A0ABN8KVD6_9BACI|nr:twin-arginine translocase subunit TatC [Neobacillus rhizosphaerae]CAH2716452.1 Sec-independent protein translocase protein TatCd [Neobacillus rhizosphaerae]
MKNQELTVVYHLGELRKRIIITLLTFIVFLFGSFIFVKEIYDWLIRDLNRELAVLGPTEILSIYFMISGVSALALTIPIATHQTWLFVKPGLTKKERKITLAYIPGFFTLFIAGLSFGYFVLYPIVLNFLLSLSKGQFETMFTAEKYFKFIINLTLPFGLLFEIPLIAMFLTSIGVINPMLLSKARKISYFLLTIISAFITPPDFMSQILVLVPLLVLYEFSVTLSKIVYRKKSKKQQSDNNIIPMKKTS